MGLFTKLGYASKAKAIAKKHSLTYELAEMGVESINQKAMEERKNTELFSDLLLYNYYKNPCAYTANNVMSLYVDVFRGLKAEVPGYEFFASVGRFLEQASSVEDIFESKEYYLNLANYELISDKCDVQKAFDVMVGIKPEYMDGDTQYMTGCLYYMLGMPDMAKKVLEVSLTDMDEEQRASANGILAMIYDKEGDSTETVLHATDALASKNPAVLTSACRLLNIYEKHEMVANCVNSELWDGVKNVRLYYEWVYALNKCGKSIDTLDLVADEEELYDMIKEVALKENRVDLDDFIRGANQEAMDEIASSELYEYADDVTKRMLNNRIMSLSTYADDYQLRDYVVFKVFYLE